MNSFQGFRKHKSHQQAAVPFCFRRKLFAQKARHDGGLAFLCFWRRYFLETQTPESMPVPSDKSQKHPPGQLSLGAMQLVPQVALALGFMPRA
jgi:hypothetical protein